ncbi:hypothetical protein D3C87_2052000 [compost metagenome]
MLSDFAIYLVHCGRDCGDGRGDFTGGSVGVLGQAAHLLGDHGEAATVLARAGGLNRGV